MYPHIRNSHSVRKNNRTDCPEILITSVKIIVQIVRIEVLPLSIRHDRVYIRSCLIGRLDVHYKLPIGLSFDDQIECKSVARVSNS